jgi:hypothetical protein
MTQHTSAGPAVRTPCGLRAAASRRDADGPLPTLRPRAWRTPSHLRRCRAAPAPIVTPPAASKNACKCQAWIDLSNNTRFCPTRATVEALNPGVLELLVTDSVIDSTCLKSDFTVVQLRDYLGDPQGYVDSIPPPPPLKRRNSGAAPAAAPPEAQAGGYGGAWYASPPAPRGGGGARALNPGAAAGIAIGVIVAAAVMGGLVWFVARPIWQERRATGFFKTKELDHDGLPVLATPGGGPPPPSSAPLSHSASGQAMAAFEAGWGRYAQGGDGGGGGANGGFSMRGGSAAL